MYLLTFFLSEYSITWAWLLIQDTRQYKCSLVFFITKLHDIQLYSYILLCLQTTVGLRICRKGMFCCWNEMISVKLFEPGHEKMCLMSYANNKGADQPAHPRSLISAFVVRCLGSIISLVSISEIFKTLASFCGCAGRFVSGLVGSSRRHVLSCRGSFII